MALSPLVRPPRPLSAITTPSIRFVDQAEAARLWDVALERFQDCNHAQGFGMGEFERGQGKQVVRMAYPDLAGARVLAQAVRHVPLPGIEIWGIRQGPLFQAGVDERENRRHLHNFLQDVRACLGKGQNPMPLHLTMGIAHDAETELVLRKNGFQRPHFERAPSLTYRLELSPDPGKNLAALDAKWRNQLRKAESCRPVFRWGEQENLWEEYVKIHNEMCDRKKMRNFRLDRETAGALRRHLAGKHLVLLGDLDGRPVCGCVALIHGSKGYYLYAAASHEARNHDLSNAMMWKMTEVLRERDVRELDLSGIDPIRNPGGAHFKRGVGGRLVTTLGDWEAGFRPFSKLIFDALLAWRTLRQYQG